MAYRPWTHEEMASYKPTDHPAIRQIYINAGIPKTEPERRARYLAEDLLELTMTDHDLLMRTAAGKGRPAALNLLEEIAVSCF